MARIDDLIMPDPKVYPRCSACKCPYVLRHGISITNGGKGIWAWYRDCKCRGKPAPEMFDERRGKARVPKVIKEVERAAKKAGVKLKPLGERRGG